MDAVEVAGCRIAYRRRGRGPSLVLLHGGLEDSAVWEEDLEALAATWDVIAWDAPGCGRSGDVPREWTADDWAEVVVGFVRAVGAEKATLAGFSLGSVLALLAARRAPDVFAQLVLIGPYAGWAGSLPPDEVAARVAAMTETASQPPDVWADGFLDTVYPAGSEPDRRRRARAAIDRWRPATTLALLDAMAVDLRGDLPGIPTPTLVIRGEHDDRSPRDASARIVDAMPAASFVEIPGAGHDCRGSALNRVLRGAVPDGLRER